MASRVPDPGEPGAGRDRAPDPGSGAHLSRRHVTGGGRAGGAGLVPPPGPAGGAPTLCGGWAHLQLGRRAEAVSPEAARGPRAPGRSSRPRGCGLGGLFTPVGSFSAAKSPPTGFAQFLGVTSRLRVTPKHLTK